jgi:hypothetical protein
MKLYITVSHLNVVSSLFRKIEELYQHHAAAKKIPWTDTMETSIFAAFPKVSELTRVHLLTVIAKLQDFWVTCWCMTWCLNDKCLRRHGIHLQFIILTWKPNIVLTRLLAVWSYTQSWIRRWTKSALNPFWFHQNWADSEYIHTSNSMMSTSAENYSRRLLAVDHVGDTWLHINGLIIKWVITIYVEAKKKKKSLVLSGHEGNLWDSNLKGRWQIIWNLSHLCSHPNGSWRKF